jgi:hypothetical protein
MATKKHKALSTDSPEWEAMFEQATTRGKRRAAREPRAVRVEYQEQSRRLLLELANGCVMLVPVDLLQGLRGAKAEALAAVTLMPRGQDLHWQQLDAQFTVAGLLAGVFGTKAWMAELGRAGGSVSSDAKRAAARANGAKGGRPRSESKKQPAVSASIKARRAA